jgi:hydrogenase expression/formation protein HypD
MRFLDEYRDVRGARRIAKAIHGTTTRAWTIMEVCGGQTHSIVRYGIDTLLPSRITLLHGPGCPVCVTPIERIETALAIASTPGVIFCTFGDMMRVPGHSRDLLSVRRAGGDVRFVYSPLDAVGIARAHPDRQVVFFAVGFETTAPANALAVVRARAERLANFSLLSAQVLVVPGMEAILAAPDNRVQGFLAAGHVCTVTGTADYSPLARRFGVPVVVTGFEPLDILQGVYLCVRQLEEGRAEVENQYTRSVRDAGNRTAQRLVREVFEVVPRAWRGLGEIPASGLAVRAEYAAFDADRRFPVRVGPADESAECRSGLVLRGLMKPRECEAFGVRCTPESPLGAPMVSSEGACAAYYRYRSRGRGAAGEEEPASERAVAGARVPLAGSAP